MKYHTHLLTLKGDGSGGWTLMRIGTDEETRLGFESEIETLESKLEEVEQWEARLKELDHLLSIQESTE